MLVSFTDAFDSELIMKTLHDILQGKTVHIPVYDFVAHSRWASLCAFEGLNNAWTELEATFEFSEKACAEWVNDESNGFQTFYRKDEFVTLYPADVVLFEGILMFYSQEIRELFQLKLFVDTDPDTRLSRRGGCQNDQCPDD